MILSTNHHLVDGFLRDSSLADHIVITTVTNPKRTNFHSYDYELNRYVAKGPDYFPLVDDNCLIDINGEIFFKYDDRYCDVLNEVLGRVTKFVRTTSDK